MLRRRVLVGSSLAGPTALSRLIHSNAPLNPNGAGGEPQQQQGGGGSVPNTGGEPSGSTMDDRGQWSSAPAGWKDDGFEIHWQNPPQQKLKKWTLDHDGQLEHQGIEWSRSFFGKMHTDHMVIDKKLCGIPFKINDSAALDAVHRHHGTAVRPVEVQRLLMPFWLLETQVNGSYRAQVAQAQMTLADDPLTKEWVRTPEMVFSYPRGEHIFFNQVSGSYLFSQKELENALTGSHVPGMMLERYELLEELEDMKVPPTIVPFQATTASAVSEVAVRTTRARIEKLCFDDLKKYHRRPSRAIIRFTALHADAHKIRPVYLPVYRIEVCTFGNSKPVPTFVCGATGKTTGPVIYISKKRRVLNGIAAGCLGSAITAIAFPLQLAALAGCAMAAAIQPITSHWAVNDARVELASNYVQKSRDEAKHQMTNLEGWKWTAEEEEKAEMEYREELRAKARRRSKFEQRVREENERDQAMKEGRAYKTRERERRQRVDWARMSAGNQDLDPLHYYAVLGLKGKELNASKKDISKAFRTAAAKAHPDLIQGTEEKEVAHKKMQSLLEAYNVLRDKKLRLEYDEGRLTHAT